MRMLNAPDRRQVLLSGLALALAPRSGWAEDARPTKIGIMNDMSSVYSDYQGIGSVVAAQLAVDDFSAKMGVPYRRAVHRSAREAMGGVCLCRTIGH